MAVADDPLQRAAGGQQFGLGGGGGHLGDKRVHRRAADAGVVAGVGRGGGLAAKHVGVFLARVVGALVGQRNHVEIEIVQPLLVQREVSRAKVHLHTQLLQVAYPRRGGGHAAFAALQVFEDKRLPFGVAQRAVAHFPARVFQQRLCTPQVVAQCGGTVGARRHGHGAKRGGRNAVAKRLHQRQLFGAGQSGGRAVSVAKQAVDALVGVVEQLAVHPLVVHGQAQRFAHTRVLKFVAAGVEHVTLKARRQVMFELTLDQLTRIKLLACHPARPVACGEETHQVEFTCLQGFELGGVVFVDFDDHTVKVVAATFDVEVTRPVVRVAHIGDVFAKPHRANFVGAAANGDVHHHLVKRFGLAVFHAPLAAEDGQAAHGQRQLAVGFVEAKTHRVVVQHIHTCHILQHGFVRGGRKRPNEGVVGVFYIGGQHRAAVVKPCLGTQAEGGAQAIVGHHHVFGQQAVARAGFVQRPCQQAVEHKG